MPTDLLVDSVRHAPVDAPVHDFDLAGWLFGLTHAEYRACSSAHIGAARSRDEGGRRVSINVERIGEDILVQHYREDEARPGFCRVVSLTDLVTPRGRTTLEVTWEVSLRPLSPGRSEFTNRIICRATPELVEALTVQGLSVDHAALRMQRLADAHNAEETPLFARNIEDRMLRRPTAIRPAAGLELLGGEVLAQSTCEAMIEAPVEAIDLAAWVLGLADDDYRACSPDHLAGGLSMTPGGEPLSLNVEAPGALMVQHYLVAEAGPGHCRLVSPRSDVFASGGRSTLCIVWELRLTRMDRDRCRLANSVTVQATPEFWAAVEASRAPLDAAKAQLQQRLSAHNAGETPNFAHDIERKALAAAAAR